MKLLKGDKGNVDFLKHVQLSELQKERLVNFLRNMFYNVELKETNSFRTDRLGDRSFMKEWEDKEYRLLFEIDKTNGEVSKKLGRSWMSIEMKRLYWLPLMLDFAAKKGVDIYKVDIKELVKEFLKEYREEISKRKEERKLKKEKMKKTESALAHIPEKRKTIKWLINLNQADKNELKKLDEEENELNIKLKELIQ